MKIPVIVLSASLLAIGEEALKMTELQQERLKRIEAEFAQSETARLQVEARQAALRSEHAATRKAICETAKIPLESCVVDSATGSVKKLEAPKPEVKK